MGCKRVCSVRARASHVRRAAARSRAGSPRRGKWCGSTGIKHGGAIFFAGLVMALHAGRVVTGADDFLLKVWSTHTGQLLRTLRGHRSTINDIAVDPTDQASALLIAIIGGGGGGGGCCCCWWGC